MTYCISILNQKGGVGKTTLAVNAAAWLTLSGKRALLVDADPQGSALDWAASRSEEPLFPVVGMPKAVLHKELPHLGKDYDTIVIDGPPRSYDVARSAIFASDVVVIPVQPSPYDVWSAKEMVDLLEEASTFTENLKAVFTINRKIANTAIGRDVQEALKVYPLPVLKSVICQRVAFAESAAQGRSIFEVDRNSLAAGEMKALIQEIMKLAS